MSSNTKECGFCGKTDNLMHMRCVPDRYYKYDFCKDNKLCEEAYGQYVYSNDLTHGLPAFILTKDISSFDVCHYCGCKENLVNVPCNSYDYHKNNHKKYALSFDFQSFCKNEKCLNRYIAYIKRDSSPEVPFIIIDKCGCMCKVGTSNCHCRAIDLEFGGRCRC
jgi:hypothetical protein